MQSARFFDLRISRIDCRTGNHHLCAGDIFCAMTFGNNRPERPEAISYGRLLQIGTRDLVAKVQQHFGDPTHADATNPDKMNALDFGKHKIKFLATNLRGFTWIKNKSTEQK